MAWFKRCKHEWYEASRYERYGPWDTESYRREYTYVHVYCPKCDARDTVHVSEWERLDGEKRIKEAYERGGK